MEFYSAKNPPPRRKFFTPGPSRVVRDSLVKQECDINHIVDRYKTTGSFLNPGISPDRRLSFGDFCDVPDLMTAQNQLIAAKEAFSALPAVVRKRFNNDSFALLEFLGNPDNKDEAIKLGLVNALVEVLEPKPIKVSVVLTVGLVSYLL